MTHAHRQKLYELARIAARKKASWRGSAINVPLYGDIHLLPDGGAIVEATIELSPNEMNNVGGD